MKRLKSYAEEIRKMAEKKNREAANDKKEKKTGTVRRR